MPNLSKEVYLVCCGFPAILILIVMAVVFILRRKKGSSSHQGPVSPQGTVLPLGPMMGETRDISQIQERIKEREKLLDKYERRPHA